MAWQNFIKCQDTVISECVVWILVGILDGLECSVKFYKVLDSRSA